MSPKHRYARSRPPEEENRRSPETYSKGTSAAQVLSEGRHRCTCWVLMRGEGPQSMDRNTADCELVPDPACPVHGKKRFPILDDEDWEE